MAGPIPHFIPDVYVVELGSNGYILLESPKSQSIVKKIDGLRSYCYWDLMDSYCSYILSGDYHHHGDRYIAAHSYCKKRIIGEGKQPHVQVKIHRHIQEDIISRLPIMSIVRFVSVCKDWYSMSHDPIFALAQISHTTATNNLHHHLLIYPGCSIPNVHLIQCNKGVTGIGAHTVFDLKPLDRDMKVIGSINGILCLIDHHNDNDGGAVAVYLYNPLLGDYLQLPNASNNKGIIMYGFGFDNARLEFKVVRYLKSKYHQIQVLDVCVVPMQGNATPQPWKTIKKFKVHTPKRLYPDMDEPLNPDMDELTLIHPGEPPLKTIDFKAAIEYTDEPFYPDELPYTHIAEPPTLVGGKLHCLTNNQYGEQLILSFDIASEEITLIPIPVHIFSFPDRISMIGELGGNLFAIPSYDLPVDMFELYVLKDYGDPESWTKLLTLDGPDEHMVPYMWNEQRILLRAPTYKWNNVHLSGSTFNWIWMEPYIVHHTPTLVSLKPNQNL